MDFLMLGLLTIDPGLRDHLGWSYWWGSPKDLTLYALGVDDPPSPYPHRVDLVVSEIPQIYSGHRQNDPNDLVDISIDAGLRIGRVAPGARVQTVKPRGWKGTVKKDVFLKRIDTAVKQLYAGTQTLAVYTAGLKAIPANLRHNAIDAVGLGLWKQGHLR